MRKSVRIILLVMMVICMHGIVAADVVRPSLVSPRRYQEIRSMKANLAITGGTANCKGTVIAQGMDDQVEIVMKLIKLDGAKERVIKTWRGTGKGSGGAVLMKTESVLSGSYKVRVTGTIKDSNGNALETKSKESAVVTR